MNILLFLDASGLDASKYDDRAVIADLLRMEAMCRGGSAVAAYWFAIAHALSLARAMSHAAEERSAQRKLASDKAGARAYLLAARTIAGGVAVSRVLPGNHLRAVDPSPTHAGATLYAFAEKVTNPFWPASGSLDGVFVEVMRYMQGGYLLDLFVSFPDRQRWQWGRRTKFRTVEEAVREGNRLATIGLAALKASQVKGTV